MASRYWVGSGSSTNWAATANTNWSATSGGANNASVPGSADDVFFDANSGVGNSVISAAITILSLNCTGYTGTITHNTSIVLTVGGNFTLVSGMTYSAAAATSQITLSGTCAFTSAAKSIGSIVIAGGVVTLQDALTILTAYYAQIALSSGTLNTNGMAVSGWNFTSNNSNVRTLTLGASIVTLTSSQGDGNNIWNISTITNLTFNPNTSTIICSNTTATAKTFAGGGLTYNNVTFSGDNITVSGNNTFNTLAVNNAGLANGLKLTNGTTQTISSLTTNGSSGSLAKLLSSSAGSAATLTKANGQVSVDYMSIKDSTAAGTCVWYAGANSTNVSGNTGWIFAAPGGSGMATKYW